MRLIDWLFSTQPFLKEARLHLQTVLQRYPCENLDDLTIRSRMPARTVLLLINYMVGAGEINLIDNAIFYKNHEMTSQILTFPKLTWEGFDANLQEKYTSLTSTREIPALIWGQRRLIPESALERSLYILSLIPTTKGRIAFLGDDDLVSPLVARLAPSWQVDVMDIDSMVLDQAEHVASALDAKINSYHADFSQGKLEQLDKYDIVVCDPFPSGDGSFETMFWRYATHILNPQGLLITTVAPSHKPLAYSRGALQQLLRNNFCILDLRADFGKYELFSFELTSFEEEILENLNLRCTIHHTKSLVASRFTGGIKELSNDIPEFDFKNWTQATTNHYLTVQAGLDKQLEIVTKRGLQEEMLSNPSIESQGLNLGVVFPDKFNTEIKNIGLLPKDLAYSRWEVILKSLNVEIVPEEIEELVRLAVSPEIQTTGELGHLGLAIRAIESWNRKRFDQRD